MTDRTEALESERAELVALADELETFADKTILHRSHEQLLWKSASALRRLAAQDQKPLWVYEDELPEGYPYDVMFDRSEIHNGVRVFPVYVSPPPAAGWDELLAKIEYASRKDSLTDHERIQSIRTLVCAEISRIDALRRPAPESGGAGKSEPDDDCCGAVPPCKGCEPSVMPDHGGADAGVRKEGECHPVLAHMDEVHDLGFKAGWEAALSKPAPVVANASAEARLRLVPLKPTGQQIEQAAHNLADEFGPEYVLEHKAFAMAAYEELVTAAPVSAGREKSQLMDALEVLKQARLYVWLDTNIPKSKTAMLSMIDAILSTHPHASDCEKQGER